MASNLKPGEQVVMVNCYEARQEQNKDKMWTVKSEPFKICGTECVMLEGKAGGFATQKLKRVEVQ